MAVSDDLQDRTLITASGERTGYWFLNDYVQMIATGEETEGRYALFEVHAPPGDQPPLHLHREADESFVMLAGEIEVWAGSTHATLRPGDYALLPRGVPHCYLVTSSEPARFLVTVTPAGFEKVLIASSHRALEPRIPDGPPELTAAEQERAAALRAASDLEQLGPPGTRP